MTAEDHTIIVVILVVVTVSVVVSVLHAPASRRNHEWYVRQWATEHGYRLVSIKLCRGPGAWGWSFKTFAEMRQYWFFNITTIDERSIERVGTAKLYPRLAWANVDERVEVRWTSERQLSPGRPGEWVRGNDEPVTEGWGADPTQRHEQRWFSAGTPTALVRDGLVVGHDPLDDPHESEGRAGS